MATQHIPAWKRLGLKLKYASEIAPSTELNVGSGGGERKRKLEDNANITSGSTDQQHQLKKTRVNRDAYQAKANREDKHATLNSPNTAAVKRKKSVTFTLDTKIEDGESAQTIQHWVPDSPGSTPKKQGGEISTAEPAESPVKRPKEKKPKGQKKVSSPGVARKASAALDYLDQFHCQRAFWKFNKNHEVWLLKHALSAEHVPFRHNLALASYIHGLKSAGARQRLIEQSRNAMKPATQSAQQDADLQTKVLQVLESNHDQDSDHEKQKIWFADQDRPQLLLLSLNENLQQHRRLVQMNGSSSTRVKKNKSRTSRVEIESSSSSESDSDSDSDSEADNDVHDVYTISKAQKDLASKKSNGVVAEPSDDTSSDGTSDSLAEDSSGDEEKSGTSSDSG